VQNYEETHQGQRDVVQGKMDKDERKTMNDELYTGITTNPPVEAGKLEGYSHREQMAGHASNQTSSAEYLGGEVFTKVQV